MKKVLSLEQMAKLKELGIDVTPKELGMIYSDCKLMYAEQTCEDDMAAFDLQDVIDLLPYSIETGMFLLDIFKTCLYYYVVYGDSRVLFHKISNEEAIDAAYEMLIWTIENGYLKVK